MRAVVARCVAVGVLLAASAPRGQAKDEPKEPTVEDVFKKVEAAVFFPDAQERLAGYECDVLVTSSSLGLGGEAVPDRKSAKALAHVAYDAATGKKTWTGPDKKPVPPGSWSPSCGFWNLKHVMRLETDFLSTPLSKRFPESDYERVLEAEDEGWRITLTPTAPETDTANQGLTPTLTRIELLVGADGVPTGGVLGLASDPVPVTGAFWFDWKPEGSRKRLDRIRNTLTSANVTVHPSLTFLWAKQGDFLLPSSIESRVPGGDLSASLGGFGDMLGGLVFEKYAVRKTK